ncbi:MAG: FAD-dependent oxidoreductase [Anaerolineae bacterium]
MKTYQEPARDLPVSREYQVIVVGGGPAGAAAAIAAGRAGANTLLVEQFGYLGGTATASLMACINGFRNQVAPDDTQVVRGIAEEIVLRLKGLGGLGKSPYPQRAMPTLPGELEYSYAIDTELYKYVLMDLCRAAGVDLLLHAWFAAPMMDGDRITGVLVETKSGRLALAGSVVIDATGDGDVAARAGAPYWQTHRDEAPRLNDALMYRIALGDGKPSQLMTCDLGPTHVLWGPGAGPLDATDAWQLSDAEVRTRLAVYEDLVDKQQRDARFVGARIIETPALLGIRQTRFIRGEYTLTADDALKATPFADAIAMSPCPIIHYYGYRRYLEHEGYSIPYRCLVPLKVEQMLVAGRCISSEQQPYESHRAMVPMMAIGQAAGVAAALAAQGEVSPRALPAEPVRKALRQQGAYLP